MFQTVLRLILLMLDAFVRSRNELIYSSCGSMA
jgi:hypothetical protein